MSPRDEIESLVMDTHVGDPIATTLRS